MSNPDILKLESAAQEAAQQQDHQQALLLRSEAIRRAKQSNQYRLAAVLLNRLGKTYEVKGEPFQAVLAFEAGLRILNQSDQVDLSDILVQKRRMRKGFSDQEESFPIPDLIHPGTEQDLEKAVKDPALPLFLLVNSANSYLNRKQYMPARKDYQLALQQPVISQHYKLELVIRSYLAMIAHRLREDAETAIDAILEKMKGPEWIADRALPSGIKADILRKKGKEEAALIQYKEALTLYEKSGNEKGQARLLLRYADLLMAIKQSQKAEKAFTKAARLGEKLNDKASKWWAYAGLGECYRLKGDLKAAIDHFEKSVQLIGNYQKQLGTDEGKVSFIQSVQEIYEHLIRSYVELGQIEKALETAETTKGQALNDLVGGRSRRKQRKKPKAREESDGILGLLEDDFPPSNMAISSPMEPPMMAQMALSIDSPPPFLEPELPLADLVNAPPLPRLIYHVLPEKLYAWLKETNGKIHFQQIALAKDDVEEKIITLRDALLVDQSPLGLRTFLIRKPPQQAPPYQPILKTLYQSLIAPFSTQLEHIQDSLVIEAHDSLWMLPFAALEDEKGQALGEKISLIYTPSHEWLSEIRQEPGYGPAKELSALLVGNPQMPPPFMLGSHEIIFEPLSGAETEVNHLAVAFGDKAKKFVGQAATESLVQSEMPQHGIIHLATHGLTLAADPLASFLIFTADQSREGMLQARDIFKLSLEAELVSLSACQTGLGQLSAEGIIGLSRAFIAAGARSVLVSLWSVNDHATSLLMQGFYRHYLAGDAKAEALRKAIIEVKSKPEYTHPRYWAGFVLIGEG